MSIVSTFNEQILNFYYDLYKVDNTIGTSYRNKILLLKNTTPYKIIEIFIESAYDYKDYIIKNDNSFFNELNDEEFDESLVTIKNNWNSYSDNTKENIWLYLNVLIKLCDKYIESKQEK
tara:strand:+ start:408 stop:764 length:357 start_codon:yes stop_codon:yes gene_type:complete